MSDINSVIDRESETENLLMDILHNNKFTINIIYAPTAVGKSSISLKLLYKLKEYNSECILIKTPPVNKSETIQEWTYVDSIFQGLKSFYSESAFSFDRFIINSPYFVEQLTMTRIEILNEANKENFIAKILFAARIEKENTIKRLIIDDERLALYAKQEYINFIFRNCEMVLVIDNLQNIDDSSLSFLKSIFSYNGLKKRYVIFEFTLLNDKDDRQIKMAEYFRSETIYVKCSHIKKTSPEYIPQIIDTIVYDRPKNIEFITDLVGYYQSSNSGNIRELIDFSVNYKETRCNSSNQTLESVLRLDDKEIVALCIILLFNGDIAKTYIEDILKSVSVFNTDVVIQDLEHKRLVNVSKKKITFAHASIPDCLGMNVSKLVACRSSAIKITKDFIEHNIIDEGKQIKPFLNVILEIYKEYEPTKISGLLDAIEKSVLIYLQPSAAWSYLKAFIQVAGTEFFKYKKVFFSILQLCFKLELYRNGYEFLMQIYKAYDIAEFPEIIIYKMMYMSALDMHTDNIEYYLSIKEILKDDLMRLYGYLIILSSYRSLGRYNDCFHIHKILNKRKYKRYVEYGYRCRLVDMYLPRHKSISFLKRSIKIFRKNNKAVQVAKSLITYTHILGGLGKIEKARNQISEAERLLAHEIIGKHMVLVNKAVINLLDGDFSEENYRLLEMAETSAIVPFDKLAIIVNKLVWCYENRRIDLIHMLEMQALPLLNLEPDRHVHCLLYYNLYLCFKLENNETKMSNYLFKAKQTMEYCNPVKARLTNKPTRETKFILTKKWHICYLAYWTFDIMLGEN